MTDDCFLFDNWPLFSLLTSSKQNTTIEERVTILENQVVVIQDDVTDLDQDVNFLFDEQVIQDERLFSLEQTSVEVIVELAEISVDLLGQCRINAFIKLFYFWRVNP